MRFCSACPFASQTTSSEDEANMIKLAIPMPSPSEQREMQQESTEGKSGEIKANEENGNEDEASKVASEPKVWNTLHAWPFGSLHEAPPACNPKILLTSKI